MKGKGIWRRWLCGVLAMVLFVSMSETAFASQKPEWRYGKSIHVGVLVDEMRTFSPEDFPGINCKKVFVLSKSVKDTEKKIFYNLVLMMDNKVNLKDAVERVKQFPMVTEAEENQEYVMNNTTLTLNHSYLYLPVGGSENVRVEKINLGRKEYSVLGIEFAFDSSYLEQISIEEGCFAKYGITYFQPHAQPWMPEMYSGWAGDENEYLFDAVARLAAAPEVKYVCIAREFIDFTDGEESYNTAAKGRSSLNAGAGRMAWGKQYDDIWCTDNKGIAYYTRSGDLGCTVWGQKPGITTFAWERCEGDMFALTSLPVIVYEPGSKNNPGDMDHNGKLDSADALQVLKYTVKLVSLDEEEKRAADLNQDNVVDVCDALLMLKIDVGIL